MTELEQCVEILKKVISDFEDGSMGLVEDGLDRLQKAMGEVPDYEKIKPLLSRTKTSLVEMAYDRSGEGYTKKELQAMTTFGLAELIYFSDKDSR